MSRCVDYRRASLSFVNLPPKNEPATVICSQNQLDENHSCELSDLFQFLCVINVFFNFFGFEAYFNTQYDTSHEQLSALQKLWLLKIVLTK